MNSSTSNFRRGLAIALIIVAMFGGLEVATRTLLFASSKDLKRFSSYPARARQLMAAPGPHIVFLGNSITERGIDAPLVARTLGVSADVFSADSSHINTWIWMMNAEFWKRQLSPELVILHFNRQSLEDGERLEIGRLAQFFTDREDWPELFEHETVTLSQRVAFVVSSAWATFAVRDRLKERILGLLPGYAGYIQVENQVNAAVDRATSSKVAAPRSWTTLRRFVARARENHTQVLIVAFPTRAGSPGELPYDIPPQIPAEIEAAGMTFLDLRRMPSLDRARHYDDDLHLNSDGREIYTRFLIAELRRLGLVPGGVHPPSGRAVE